MVSIIHSYQTHDPIPPSTNQVVGCEWPVNQMFVTANWHISWSDW